MRINEQTPITYQDSLPDQVDVVIIGAGILGIATAWYLLKEGKSVLVCEKGRVAGEQSSRNWGWVRQTGRDAAELPIQMESTQLWANIASEINEDVGFAKEGSVYLAKDESELSEYEDFIKLAKSHNLDSRMLNRAQTNELIKNNTGDWISALYTPSDARAEPFLAVPAMARAVNRMGGKIRENCAVRELDSEGGKVVGVITEHGRVRADAVLCAAGAWSASLGRHLGVDIPQLTVRNTVLRTATAPDVFAGNASSLEFAFRRRQDGGYTLALPNHLEHYVGADSFRYCLKFLPSLMATWSDLRLRFDNGLMQRLIGDHKWDGDTVSPFEKKRVLDPEPNQWEIVEIRRRLAKCFPSLANVVFEEAWAGMIEATPDVVPIMDHVDKYPGFYVATGFSGHGFGFGLGAARVMADMLQGKTPRYDLHRFRLSRFTDGSKLILGPGI